MFMLLATLAYLPGLSGGFVFDDATSIVENNNIHVKDGTFAEWSLAAVSFPSGTPPFRSLTMLSFAANYYLGGLDPFGYKLTNLVIHLLNGLLLFLALRGLFALQQACAEGKRTPLSFKLDVAAACIAGAWMLLPINLTAVLYTVQRLESLATTFIFLGMAWYAKARLRHWSGEGGALSLWMSLIACTALGVLAKEPGILLPLYAGLAELILVRGRNQNGHLSRPVLALFGCALLLPFVLGSIWLWGRYFDLDRLIDPNSFVIRRMMTEAGILLDYMAWTLIPSLDSLTLHHDDIQLVNGILEPVSTLPSILGLLALIVVANWQLRRRPLFALGIALFFAGHLLTATVVPLVLAFEHRNYFSSAGLLLACASILFLEPGILSGRLRIAVVAIATLFFATTTWMRAQEWSSPMRQIRSDAAKRPNSPSAQIDYALALINEARKTGDHRNVDAVLKLLDIKRSLPGAGIIFEQTMISVLAPSHMKVPDAVWRSLVAKLRSTHPKISDTRSLSWLNHCFISEKCNKDDIHYLREAYAAAMSHPDQSPTLLSVHAEFTWYIEGDHDSAERDIREAVRRAPRDIAGRKNLIVVLIHQGKREEAKAMIEELEAENVIGSLDAFIAPLRKALMNTPAPAPHPASSP